MKKQVMIDDMKIDVNDLVRANTKIQNLGKN